MSSLVGNVALLLLVVLIVGCIVVTVSRRRQRSRECSCRLTLVETSKLLRHVNVNVKTFCPQRVRAPKGLSFWL